MPIEHPRPVTNSNGTAVKISLPWAVIIGLAITLIGWGVKTEVSLARIPDREEVLACAKEQAASAAAPKASKDEVSDLRSDVRVLIEQMKEQNKKLDRLLEKRER